MAWLTQDHFVLGQEEALQEVIKIKYKSTQPTLMCKSAKSSNKCPILGARSSSSSQTLLWYKFWHKCRNSCKELSDNLHQLTCVYCYYHTTLVALTLVQQDVIGIHLKNIFLFKQHKVVSIQSVSSETCLHYHSQILHETGLNLSWKTYQMFPAWKKNSWKDVILGNDPERTICILA